MQRTIISFYQDQEQHWVALLSCGHSQHVRHRPPQVYREWVLTAETRAQKLGVELNCLHCDLAETEDSPQT